MQSFERRLSTPRTRRGLLSWALIAGVVVALPIVCRAEQAMGQPSTGARGAATPANPPLPSDSDEGADGAARAAFERGVSLAQDAQWTEAVLAFKRSLALAPRPVTRFNLAVALYRCHRYPDALRALSKYLSTPHGLLDPTDLAEALDLRELTVARVARLQLSLSPSTAHVSVDGERTEPVALGEARDHRLFVLQPGARRIAVRAEGHQPTVLSLSLSAGELREQTVALQTNTRAPRTDPAEPLPPSTASRNPAAAGDSEGSTWSHPALWISVGLVVVAASVVGAAVATDGFETSVEEPNGGSTGHVYR